MNQGDVTFTFGKPNRRMSQMSVVTKKFQLIGLDEVYWALEPLILICREERQTKADQSGTSCRRE